MNFDLKQKYEDVTTTTKTSQEKMQQRSGNLKGDDDMMKNPSWKDANYGSKMATEKYDEIKDDGKANGEEASPLTKKALWKNAKWNESHLKKAAWQKEGGEDNSSSAGVSQDFNEAIKLEHLLEKTNTNASRVINWMIQNMPHGKQTIIVL